MTELTDKVVVVTGAGGAAGPPAVHALKQAGATVIAADAVQEALEQFSDVATRVVDLLDDDATTAWAQELKSEYGHVDGVIHLVGGWRGGQSFTEEPLQDWDFLEQRLIRTLQRTTRAFYPMLSESDAGRLAIISAKAASSPTTKGAYYAAAKAATEAWMLAVAHSWKDSETAAAVMLIVNGLLTEKMRAENPNKPYRTMTHVDDVAAKIVSLWDEPAAELNGERLWLTP